MSSSFTEKFAPFDPNYYYDGKTEWAVNSTGRIAGEYADNGIPILGGRNNLLGFKVHRKGKNQQKGNKNKKYIPPINPNKRSNS